MSLHSWPGAVALVAGAILPLAGCDRASGDSTPLPNVASIVPAASAPAPSFSLPTGGAASAGTGAVARGRVRTVPRPAHRRRPGRRTTPRRSAA